jgi:hypothetical protein
MKTSLPLLVSLLASVSFSTPVYAQGRANPGGPPPNIPRAQPPAPPAASRPMTPPAPARPDATRPELPARGGMDAAASRAAPAAVAGLGLAMTQQQINQTAFEARRELLQSADMSLAENREALRAIQSEARTLRGEARTEFRQALGEFRASDRDLQRSIRAANRADAEGWATAQERMAAARQRYAEAMARLEAARGSPLPPAPQE